MSKVKDSDVPAVQWEFEQLTVGDATAPITTVGLVIYGVEVLRDLGDTASSCALLMPLIYVVNLIKPR